MANRIIVWDDPVNWIDPIGLIRTTVDAAYEQAILSGNIAEAQAIAEAMGWATAVVATFSLEEANRASPNACAFARGKDDKYGPLWNAPGMPGWSSPSSDPNDPNFMKEPDDYDKWSKWKKFKWQAKKFAAKISSAFHNP